MEVHTEPPGRDPDVGWGERYRILVWMCVLICVNQLGFGSVVPVVPLYARSFGVPQSAIGLTIGIYGLARFLINVPAGNVADRLGRRGTLVIGGALTVLGNVACGLAPGYSPFLVGRFVAGAGAAFTLTAGQIVLADISTPEKRGRMMATYMGVFAFAVGVGSLPGGLLAEHVGLSTPFFAFALLSAAAGAVAWLRVPETREFRSGPATAVGVQRAPSFASQVRLLTTQVGFALVCLVSFSASFARTGALFNVIPVLAQSRMHLTAAQIAVGISFVSIASFALAYPSGVMVDRFGRKAVIVPATVISGASMVLFAVAPTFPAYLAACAVWSVALGISSDAPGAYAADMAPRGMNAAAMSSYRMLSDVGYVAGPLLLGFIADRSGAVAALVVTAALLTAVGSLFAKLAPETHAGAKRPVCVSLA